MTHWRLAWQCKIMLYNSRLGAFSNHSPECSPSHRFRFNILLRSMTVAWKSKITLMNGEENDLRTKFIQAAGLIDNFLLILPVVAFIEINRHPEPSCRQSQH